MQQQLGIWEPSHHLLATEAKASVPQREHSATITRIKSLTIFKEIIAVYIENRIKPTNTKCRFTFY
jgi:hypothetical protein